MSHTSCDRCGQTLASGATRYVLSLRVTSDWDGHVSETSESREELLALLDQMSAQAAEAEVDLQLAYTVCPGCRKKILQNPLQRPGGRARGQVH